MIIRPGCPEPAVYQRLAAGELPADQKATLLSHLEECPECAQTVGELPGCGSLVRQLLPTQKVRKPAVKVQILGKDNKNLCDFLAPPERPDELGRLGTYRVLRVLGAGGMGVVFCAEDEQLQRLVALKTMLPRLASSDSARQRFLREARAAAALKHDHIVAIYQVGEHCGVPFLAMEFLEGESLDDRLKREGKLGLGEVLRIGRETALALAAAHQRGLVHRDIKPPNLWLEQRDPLPGKESAAPRVKLLDFGLAHGGEGDAHLTEEGIIIGTPAYMSPEQANGKLVDFRSDLFSLGCVMYHMITGQLPFSGVNSISTLLAIASHQPPTPRHLDAALPEAVSDLVMQLLAKDPAGRPRSAHSVAEELANLERAYTQSAPSPPPPRVAERQRPSARQQTSDKEAPASSRPRPSHLAPPEPLAEYCLLIAAPPAWLDEAIASASLSELRLPGRPWLGPHEILFKARLAGREMPVVFARAGRRSPRIDGWGIIKRIDLERGATLITCDGVQPIEPARQPSELLTRQTGKPLDLGPRCDYALCVTPPFLYELVGQTPARGSDLKEPAWPRVPRGSWLDKLRARPADEAPGGGREISGRELVSHLLHRHQQQEARIAAGGKENIHLNLAIHAIQHPDAMSAVPALIKLLKGNDVFYQLVAAECLRHVGPGEKGAVDFLLEKLKDDHRDVRAHVVPTLLQIGPTSKASLELLLEALRDEDESIRAWAVACLARIGPAAASAVDALLRAMKGVGTELRVKVIDALGAIQADPARVVPRLQRALEHKDVHVRAHAVQALARYGPQAADALPALLQTAKHEEDATVQELVSLALRRIQTGRPKPTAVEVPQIAVVCSWCRASTQLKEIPPEKTFRCPKCGLVVPALRELPPDVGSAPKGWG